VKLSKLTICICAIMLSINLYAQSDKGVLVIYRDYQLQGQGLKYPVMINDSAVVMMKVGTLYKKSLPAGKYKVSAKTEMESGVEVNILPNDTSYVRCGVNMGFWIGRPDIIQVDKNSAKSTLSSIAFQDVSNVEYKTFVPKGSVGLLLGFNGGLERFDVFMMENNKYSTLSTGGSFNIGAQVNFILHKNIELSADIRYQGASLSPSLKNATAHFGRGVTHATVYAVAPLKNEIMKLKFGAGLGYHFNNNMEIDGSDVDGNKLEAEYNSALAIRFGTVFETTINRYGFAMGLFYNNVNYEVTKVTINSMPAEFTDDKLSKPNGSNIEFMLGYYLYF